MKTTITITCPSCLCHSIKKNGVKSYGKQNYFCKNCHRQFVQQSELSYKGCYLHIDNKIRLMLARGCSIADIVVIEQVSKAKVLSVLTNSNHKIKPKQQHYDTLEVDEFWTYVGNKKNKVWLIYAYDKGTGEIVAFVWGKRNLATAKKLKIQLTQLGITFNKIACDDWDSFLTAFKHSLKQVGKRFTVGIEGNNTRLRTFVRRAFRRTCCFSKKLENHFKAFELVFHYINYGWV
ncbi:Transposase and inactivated derivatives [Moraxella caprae]|uniref:Transposase and inactivated derivatives n=2 Tax=Moraxella caprae TaxID=90240 RepID=A0A378QZM1_9GAMM|nr:IS1 family transposase [Moraxella caprae]STZ07608.1 Transposase and inactivated derivatives [Moraxella caprae]STZ07999.1 Transposase and inactivated derivatives [Moraxella caprae]STZ08948.1 Transposase and inactivated derivatives [Moraxella caprae]STZ09063.1 Transposase and inactivated derivatives [Moraxella caprae]